MRPTYTRHPLDKRVALTQDQLDRLLVTRVIEAMRAITFARHTPAKPDRGETND